MHTNNDRINNMLKYGIDFSMQLSDLRSTYILNKIGQFKDIIRFW